MLHERRAKSCRIPPPQVLFNVGRFIGELSFGSVQFSVVFQPVHAHFEAVATHRFSQLPGHHVITRWNEVKRRTKAVSLLQLH
jgi:hypothetical protein